MKRHVRVVIPNPKDARRAAAFPQAAAKPSEAPRNEAMTCGQRGWRTKFFSAGLLALAPAPAEQCDELAARADIERAEDLRDMIAHGVRAFTERFGDLRVAPAF
jgi:hypothetical protein